MKESSLILNSVFSLLSQENIYDLHAKYFDVENPEVAFNYLRLLDDVCNNSFLYSQYLVDFEPSMQRRGHLVTTNRFVSNIFPLLCSKYLLK